MTKQTSKKIFLLSFGILLIDLSILYLNQNGKILLNQTMLIPLYVSFIFGFFHGYKTFLIEKFIDNKISLLSLVYLSFIYTAWYNVILLPLSGFGVIEWDLFLFIIFSDFILLNSSKYKEKISYITSSGKTLLIFGSIMSVFKFIMYFIFPDNIYEESFIGNPTARLFVLAFNCIGILFLLLFLKNKIKAKMSFSKKQKDISVSILKRIINQIKKFFNLILSLISSQAAIIIIGIIILVGGILIVFEINAICEDILEFIEPFLIKFSSTGKSAISPSIFYFISNFIVLISVLVFGFYYENQLEDKARENIGAKIIKKLDENTELSNKQKNNILTKKKQELKNTENCIILLSDTDKLEKFLNY